MAETKVYHHYFAGAQLTTCGVPIERGHVMPELNDVTCEACQKAWHERRVAETKDTPEPSETPEDRT